MRIDKQPVEPSSTESDEEITRVPASTAGQGDAFVGSIIGGRYQIERELGRGGLGAVFLALDLQMASRPVAVKILLDTSLQNEWAVQKFRAEMEALARVEHPHMVGVYDFGETAEGIPYLVMQYVKGTNLRAELNTKQGMGLKRLANIMRQIGEGLQAAHEAGVLHRDLKPENIMLRRDADGREHVKIIDFGIAKVKNPLMSPSTLMEMTVGTVA
jgi:serine/threonine-protein kinase